MTDEDAVVDRRRFVGRLAAAGGVAAGATVGSSMLFPTAAAAATDIDLTNTARVKNALDAANDQDYVTKKQVKNGNPIIVAASGQPAEVQAAALLSGGAVCDGTNDQVEIQAALLAGSTSGRAVMLSAGTFHVNTVSHPNWAGAFTALFMYTGSVLLGRSAKATTIRLVNNATNTSSGNNAYVITTELPNSTGNTDIYIGDLTIDGNAANQTGANKCFHGITFWRSNRTVCERVVVMNMRGLSATDPNTETFGFDVVKGANASFIECRAARTSGSMADGFSANHSTAIRYDGCVAEGMSIGAGFTMFMTSHVGYVNCHARNNAGMGFNWEYSDNVTYVGCHAGGSASQNAATGPYANNQSFGNTQHGFNGLGGVHPSFPSLPYQGHRAELIGCTSTRNGGCGVMLQDTRDVSVVGGSYSNNGDKGVNTFPLAAAQTTRLAAVVSKGNTVADYDVPGWRTWSGGALEVNFVVPASGVHFANPFPFDVTVYLIGGTFTAVNIRDRLSRTRNIGAPRTVILPRECSMAITYTVAPTWDWIGG